MNIGIIGLGVVGSAVKRGFEGLGHSVRWFDIKCPETSLQDVLDTELCFLTVPTPSSAKGGCDTSIVREVADQLSEKNYQGIVVIKSTVTPGTADDLSKQYPLRFAVCSEFLRERCAYEDFVDNHDVCIIGAYDDTNYELIKHAHGTLPKQFARLTPLEAEFAKYFSNVFNALRITFANEFYEVCESVGADYTKIKNAMVKRSTIQDVYLDCSNETRGFGGVCLPKDTAAFAAFVKLLGLDLKLFETILEENRKFKKTVFKGMRE
jgi:UDPglucose 6-dehydrogenase